jgi:hypothetical protein
MADQQDRPEPDHSDDPRDTEVGEGGYAEEQPGDAGGGSGGAGERAGDDEAADRAPKTSSPSEGEPGEASGNPDAAGA